ncbi:MAG TPA: DUF1684 domain-containing protein [Thermoanaerobaculia bacterium]|nr:DUF1684 domain-containing protein [Thermoanaerobaculia bacterium]
MKRSLLTLLLAVILACGREKPSQIVTSAPAPPPPDPEKEAMQWRESRLARLKAEDGWLSLVGLTWLSEGANSVTLPVEPPVKVRMQLQNGKVTLQPDPGGSLTSARAPVAEPIALRDDNDPKGPTIVERGSLRFHIIKRGDRYGVRMKDPNSSARTQFTGLDYFPFNPKWRVVARFIPFEEPRRVPIANVTGMTTEELSPGTLTFSVDGAEYSVQPILETGEKDFFIIFKDETSGKETYPAARYVYAPPPGPDGTTVIDFNRAYNPPCVFTPFATCPLPPPQNRLRARVEAGEKNYHSSDTAKRTAA